MIGRTLSHYKIIAKLGEGGMGVVYRAEDTELERQVALKVLPAEMAADPGRLERFRREAKAVAALDHPNIVTMYSVEEVDGVHFLTMALIEGTSLEDSLRRGGLPLARLLDLGSQIADALATAHGRGVAHRDLKPANVMVDADGRIKILDFGLAKLVEREGLEEEQQTLVASERLTQEGAAIGTLPYMSPEQLRGEPVDRRTDIFSLGAVLHEMATGRRPFQAKSSAELTSSILNDAAPAVTELNSQLPRHLARIIQRCLEKNPRRRYQSALDVRNELDGLRREMQSGALSEGVASEAGISGAAAGGARSAASSRTIYLGPRARRGLKAASGVVLALAVVGGWWVRRGGQTTSTNAETATVEPADGADVLPFENQGPVSSSVAVLPFENISADARGEVFTAGIHDDLITKLAQIAGLKTISRTSVLEYKDTPKSIPKIGRELGVAAVVEGGVQRAGDLVRINVKLIDTSNEENLWAESYDRELSARNIFAIQSEIASAVAIALEATLSPAEKNRLEALPTTDFEAYDLYLQGMEAYKRPGSNQHDLLEAVEKFRRAIALDPAFALAYARLSHAHREIYWQAGDPTEERLARAFEAAESAIELAPDLAEGHYALGVCFYVTRDFSRASEAYELAARAMPGSAELARSRAALTRRMGGFEESVPQYARLLELDPRDADHWFEIGITHSYLDRYAVAERLYSKALEIAPGFTLAQVYLAVARTNREATRAHAQRELAAFDPLTLWQSSLTGVAWRMGLQSGAPEQLFDILAPAGELVSQQEFDYPKSLLLAITHELAGNPAEAADAYRSAVELLEPLVAARPDYAHHHGALGLAYAGLGRRREAVREGRRAVELMPIEKDVFVGSWQLGDLGFIYVRTGDHEAAIDTFARYLSRPRLESALALALDPRVEPLLEDPRFRQLVGLAG